MSNIGRPRQLLAAVGSCLVDLFQLLSAKSQKISSKVNKNTGLHKGIKEQFMSKTAHMPRLQVTI